MRTRGFEVLEEFKELNELLIREGKGSLLPRRATRGSSGCDFRSVEDVTINPGEIVLVGTGVTAYMQEDEELQLRGRSGLSTRGLSLANGTGTVDSDYYGKHIKFIYQNRGSEPFEIHIGDRIGQGIFAKYLLPDNDNPMSESREGGFGSTGT